MATATWRFAAIGVVLAGLIGFFASCGANDSKDEDEKTTGATLSYATDIKPIIAASCSGTACHSTGALQTVYVDNETLLKTNKVEVKARINATSPTLVMPQPNTLTLSTADRTKIVTFLDQ